ncbi:hypothetical protein [Herbidospora mongoliensis]|uniref:hypothetical protein n=1 Tax=Herbidospora mongoliensis TaxID=688067 RepID=UPI00082F16E2
MWRTDSGAHTAVLGGHDDVFTSVVFMPNGELISGSSRTERLRVWGVLPGIIAYQGRKFRVSASG